MKRLRWLFTLLPLAAIAITIFVITRSHGELGQPNDVASALSQAQGAYFMENVQSTSYDKEGRMSHTLHSPRIDHFPEENRSDIQTPHLTVVRPEGPPWELDARKGIAHHPEEILLEGEVRLHRASDARYVPVEMKTQALLINARSRQASSEEVVRFESPQGQVTGKGLRANLGTEQLELLANVEGVYVQTP